MQNKGYVASSMRTSMLHILVFDPTKMIDPAAEQCQCPTLVLRRSARSIDPFAIHDIKSREGGLTVKRRLEGLQRRWKVKSQ